MNGKKIFSIYLESRLLWWVIFILLVAEAVTLGFLGYFELSLLFIVATVVHILIKLVHRLRRITSDLVTASTLPQLIEKYLAFMISALVIFTILYALSDFTQTGYITYGQCSDTFVYGSVPSSRSFFYFSAVTMFTVGYGDVCPMGLSKGIAILNMLVGQMFTVVFLGAAIGNLASKK